MMTFSLNIIHFLSKHCKQIPAQGKYFRSFGVPHFPQLSHLVETRLHDLFGFPTTEKSFEILNY